MNEFYIVILQNQMAIVEHYAFKTPEEAIAKFKELENKTGGGLFSIACAEDLMKPNMKLYSSDSVYTAIAYKEYLQNA